MTIKTLLFLLLSSNLAVAQGTYDFSGAVKTIPWKVFEAEPGVCAANEIYYNSTTSKLRRCISKNLWSDLLTAGTTASQLGAVLDCDLATGTRIGGGVATDNTAKLQTYLNTASAATPAHLIIDGPSLITGLKIVAAGYTTIEGRGGKTGFYLKTGSSASGIESNGADSMASPADTPTATIGAAPARGAYVQLLNFRINGNRGTFTGATYNASSGNVAGANYQGNPNYAFNINLSSLDHVQVSNIWSINSPAWNIRLANVGDVVVRDCWIHEDIGTVFYGDGVDIVGPANDVRIDGVTFDNLGDDAIALTSAVGTVGPISRVTIANCTFNATTAFIRIFSSYTSTRRATIDGVAISNVSGNATLSGITFDWSGAIGATATDWTRHVSISNTRITAPNFIQIDKASIGDLEIANSVWHPTAANQAINIPSVAGTTGIGTLTLNGFTIYRDASGSAAGTLLTVPSGATLGRVELNGVRVVNAVGGSTAALAFLIDVQTGGTLTRLWVGSLDPTLITTPFSAAGTTNITNIQGPGVTAAGMTAK